MASVFAKCADNECVLTFLRERQKELCGEWDGALTRAFRLAIISISEQTQPLRTLNEASKLKHIGPSMQRQLRAFFTNRPPVQSPRSHRPIGTFPPPASAPSSASALSRPMVQGGQGDIPLTRGPSRASAAETRQQAMPDPDTLDLGSVPPAMPTTSAAAPAVPCARKSLYVPKKGSAAYAIIITMLFEKLKGRDGMLKEELVTAAEKCGYTDVQMRPTKPQTAGGRPYLDRSAPRTFYCGWSSMETLKKNSLVTVAGRPAKYCLTADGHAVALECVKRGRILLPSPEDLHRAAAAAAAAGAGNAGGGSTDPASSLHPQEALAEEDFPLGLAAMDPTATPVSIVERSSFDTLRLPPLRPGEKFEQAYHVLLLIDNREGGPNSRISMTGAALAEQLESQYRVTSEVRHLPVGDALWIARHQATGEDFVLDFILERKRMDDLWASIKSKRFKDQKLRLQRCGLRKLLYLVEGRAEEMNGADAVRTAALQTEVEDGFDVQRTTGQPDTLRRYADLTSAIRTRYSEAWNAFAVASATGANAALFGGQERCMTFQEFLHVCRHINADTVGDLFGHMLLQIRSVTVDIAMAIMQKYPTLRTLAEAYRALEGNTDLQGRMLTDILVKSKPITEGISRKVYEFVWT